MALEAILASKRAEVRARRAARPLERLVAEVAPTDRSFEAALRARHPAFILEIKPRSPSEGPLRDPGDLAGAIASYGRHADAVSVLTDRPYFGGSFELLGRVRAAIGQPVLCKDFIVDQYQVFEARAAGADAVLLMLSVLDDAGYRAAADVARSLGMGILTEVHSAGELVRAESLGARVIGINNRDLTTLAVDRATAPALAARAPAAAVVIAESGIRGRDDLTRLGNAVDGVLVGTALMRAADVDHAVRDLVYGPTKVCGLTRPEDAIAALEAGATHGGLVFAAESPRRVTLERARAIRAAAGLRWVGVFVNDPAERIAAVAGELGLAAVQLHGEEPDEVIDRLRDRLEAGTEIWRAVRVRAGMASTGWSRADRILLDAHRSGSRGGTGTRFDWSLLEGLAGRERWILSGGLAPENLPEALATGVAFLDVSSGVESAPGIKDPIRLDRFFAARRARPAREGAIR